MRTADLVDDHDDKVVFCEIPWRWFGRKRAFSGPAVTVKCHEDNVVLDGVLKEPGEGRVLVIDAGGSRRLAVMGDRVAGQAVDNGWAGVVLWGSVRDSEELMKMDVAVLALGTSPKKSAKEGAGLRDMTVRFGGATFSPGDWVYADADGVLVSREKLI